MFTSLRAKLAIAFAVVTVLTVVALGVGVFFLLRDREVQAATQKTGDLLPPETRVVGAYAALGRPNDEIIAYLRQEATALDVRFILLDDSNQVLLDTAGKQSGQFTALNAGKSGRNLPNSYHVTSYQEGPTQYVVYRQPSGLPGIKGYSTVVRRQFQVLMLVPESRITSAWHELAPRLLIAGGLAFVAALALAFLIARSITRPIVRITRASEAMAQGQYEQQIPVEGRDEVARLARSFNGMAAQVSHSHQMMRDLLANVAHELKTPLTSIQGFSQAMSDGALQSPDEFSNAARIINLESERMRRLVNDLLLLSQIESGQAALDRRPVAVAALVAMAGERIRWQLDEQSKHLVAECEESLPAVFVDEPRIEQVLANLLDNALRHTPSGGTITLRALAPGPLRVRIEVHNTGSVIPAGQLDRIFERFYQVDRARTRNGRNGGLGLAIAREIVNAHGGTISASSDPEAGTTFSVTLPATTKRPPAAERATALAAELAPTP